MILSHLSMNDSYKKIFILLLVIFVVLTCTYIFPQDDALRHVGLAFGNFTSWGNVYPFSIFEEFKDYDPWFGYDLTLRIIADTANHLPISTLTLKFLMTKALPLLFLSVFLYLVMVRSGLFEEIKDRDTFTLVLIILIVFLVFPLKRIMIARPFAFGTFFLIYSVGKKGFARGGLSSLALTFFYPYLSWFYIVPVAVAHLIKGDKKFAMGAVSIIILFLLMQPPSFWGFQIALFKSDIVRNAIDSKIGEFNFTLKSTPFYFCLVGFFALYPRFSKKAKSLNYTNILIFIYLLPSLKYVRYFIDLTLPLLFVSFGKEMLCLFLEPYQNLTSSWKRIIQSGFEKIKSITTPKSVGTGNKKAIKKAKPEKNIKPYIAIGYSLIFVLLIIVNFKQVASFKDFNAGLIPIPEKSLILTTFNLQYKTLFLRPDLRLIPSCELGFARPNVLKEYRDFFNEGLVTPLSRKTGAKYFLERGDMYINPQEGRALELVKKCGSLKLWKILD